VFRCGLSGTVDKAGGIETETLGAVVELSYFIVTNVILIAIGYDLFKGRKMLVERPSCSECGKESELKCGNKGCNNYLCRDCLEKDGCKKCHGVTFVKIDFGEYRMTKKGWLIGGIGVIVFVIALVVDLRGLYNMSVYANITRVVLIVVSGWPVMLMVTRIIAVKNSSLYTRLIKSLEKG